MFLLRRAECYYVEAPPEGSPRKLTVNGLNVGESATDQSRGA